MKDRLWASLDTAYFLRHDAQEIAWHTRNLHYRVDGETGLELGRRVARHALANDVRGHNKFTVR